MVYIAPLNEKPFVTPQKICFLMENVTPEQFEKFKAKNSKYMTCHNINYHYSVNERELYVMALRNTPLSSYFISYFSIAAYCSVSIMVLTYKNGENINQIMEALNQQKQFYKIDDNGFDGTYQTLILSTFFSPKVHHEIFNKIQTHANVNIYSVKHDSHSNITESMRDVHHQYDDFKRIRRCNGNGDAFACRNNLHQSKPSINEQPFAKRACLSEYSIRTTSNVEFTFKNGVLTVENGAGTEEHEDIAHIVAEHFRQTGQTEHCNNDNKRKRMF